jgi:hypothetical protein
MKLDTNKRTHRAVLVVEETKVTGFGGDFFNSCQFEVEAEFSYSPGFPPILTGPMENADSGCPPEINILSLRPLKDVEFNSEDTVPVSTDVLAPGDLTVDEPGLVLTARAGRNILNFFSTREIGLFEDELLARALSKDTDD